MRLLKFVRNLDFRYKPLVSYAAVLGRAIVYPLVRRMVESHFERELRNSNEATDGPGMSGEVRRRIFEPFYPTLQVGGGTGLGLSVPYFIITESHGGRMSVESAQGQGARFVIRLPLARGRS